MKLGRNDPCHCGSGKKYKKCCLNKDKTPEIPREILERFQRANEKEQFRRQAGIYVRFVNPVEFQGGKVWALANTVYHRKGSNETFHEFIINILREKIGKEWWNNELAKPEEERHFIFKCFLKFFEWQRKNYVEANRVGDMWGAVPDGWSKSLLSLAWDVCSLIQSRQLPEELLRRLKNNGEYQGARYEISIAAIFARLNCKIDWQNDKPENISKKHCEFIATHLPTNLSIAIEVKSKHRAGVIHMPGSYTEKDLAKGNIKKLLKEALTQNPGDIPFMIFIDLNTPSTPGIPFDNKPWVKDVQEALNGIFPNPNDENPCSAIFITNYSYHYQTDKDSQSGEYIGIFPNKPKYPFKDWELPGMLKGAFDHYGYVPNYDLDEREDLVL